MVTELALGHAFRAGAAFHFTRPTTMLQLTALGFLLIAVVMAIALTVAQRRLRQTGAQGTTMCGTRWRERLHMAAVWSFCKKKMQM